MFRQRGRLESRFHFSFQNRSVVDDTDVTGLFKLIVGIEDLNRILQYYLRAKGNNEVWRYRLD